MNLKQNVYSDIENAIKIINFKFYQGIDEFSKYSGLYAFTNENLLATFNLLNLKNKSLLTVAGSGDSIFEAYLQGVKKVYSFDINCLAKYYIELKKAGVKALGWEDFICFFFNEPDNEKLFQGRLYCKIRSFLKDDNIIFWDSLFRRYNGNRIRNSKLFYTTEESYEFLSKTLSYLNPSNYQLLKNLLLNDETIDNISFTNANMLDINNMFTEQFDVIYLSNVADYIQEFYKKPYLDNFKNDIENKFSTLLKENGQLVAAYLFAYNAKTKFLPPINKTNLRKKVFKNNYQELIIDNQAFGKYPNDHILVYKKRNRD